MYDSVLSKLEIDYVPKDAKQLCVFLHGFPGPVVEYPDHIGTSDLLKAKIDQDILLSVDYFAFRYPGLGKSEGSVSFLNSFVALENISKFIGSRNYESISIVCQSFGALLSFELFHQLGLLGCNVSKCIMLTPMINIENDDKFIASAKQLKAFLPKTFEGLSLEDLGTDFLQMKNKFNPLTNYSKYSKNIDLLDILFSEKDEIVPMQDQIKILTKMKINFNPSQIEGATHNLTPDQKQFALDWILKCLRR